MTRERPPEGEEEDKENQPRPPGTRPIDPAPVPNRLLGALLGRGAVPPFVMDRPTYRRLVAWIADNCRQLERERGDLPETPQVVDLCHRAFEPYQPLGLWSTLHHASPRRVRAMLRTMLDDEDLVGLSAVGFLSELSFHLLLDEVYAELGHRPEPPATSERHDRA